VTTADQRELVAALLSVDGVADAAVEESDDEGSGGGPGSLRLLLRPGADEVGVATAVNRVLRDRFGLAVDSDRVAVVEEPAQPDPVPAKGAKGGASKVSGQRGRPGASAAGAGAITAAAVVAEAEARLERESGAAAPAGTAAAAEGTTAAPAAKPAAPKPDRAAAGASTVEVAGAELPKTADAPRAAGSTRRPTIERVEVVTAGLNVSSAVTLGLGARSETGRADGMASAAGVHRTVATATLSAVEELVEGSARFQLEHVEIASAAGERTALALVTMLTERGGEQLSGSSVVREDQRQAVIRAVLAAVNRRVEPLLG
jgi:hypothetical protein